MPWSNPFEESFFLSFRPEEGEDRGGGWGGGSLEAYDPVLQKTRSRACA